ncbi:TPA: hypothetical protein ACKP1B_001230 [Serratia fonticola]
MTHSFFEFPLLPAKVTDVAKLKEVINSNSSTSFVMTPEVAKFVKDALVINTTIGSFKNTRFQFADGTYIAFDSKGKSTQYHSDNPPDWARTKSEYSRTQWLTNHGLIDAPAKVLIARLLEIPLKERRDIADNLLNLDLDKLMPTAGQRVTPGNRNGKSTKPKISDLGSVEYFRNFFARLRHCVATNAFPTLQKMMDLGEQVSLTKAPTSVKQAVRTYYKAVCGEQIPNNKVVEKGYPELYCMRIKPAIDAVEAIGLETYYAALSTAIGQAGDCTIADFDFHYR